MEPSRKNRGSRSVFDVQASRHKKWLSEKTLNLKPNFLDRHPWLTTAGVFLAAILAFWGAKWFFASAEVSDFYPASCLGTWQSPSKAQGQPDSLVSADTPIDATSSAILNDRTGQIFCGTFVPPETEEKGDIRSVGLTLVWNVTGLPVVPSSTPSSTPEVLGESTSTATSSDAVPATPTSFFSKFSPLALFIDSAYADDIAQDTSTPSVPPPPAPPASDPTSTPTSDPTSTPASAPTSTPTSAPTSTSGNASTSVSSGPTSTAPTSITSSTTPSVPSSTPSSTPVSAPAPSSTPKTEPTSTQTSTVIIVPPVSATLTPIASDTIPEATTTPPLPPPPPPPDDNFLLVSYSMDGNTWVPLQKVNAGNWENLTLTLPVNSWEDLKKLQLKIEGIESTLTETPKIFLDGMFVEVHYDLPPVFARAGDTETIAPTSSQLVEVSPNVVLEIPPQEPTPFVPPPTIVGIEKSGNTVTVTVQYVGDFYGGNSINVFMYPPDMVSRRGDADDGFTFSGDPTGPMIDSVQLFAKDFDPTTKQVRLAIISPQGDAGYGTLSADKMSSGTYQIDVAYYDSQTWHLIPAQSFIWP